MNAKLLLILGAVLGLIALAFLVSLGPKIAPSKLEPSGDVVTSGRFVLERGDSRWVDESFTLFLRPNGHYFLVSQSVLTVPGATVRLAQQTEYGADYRPLTYQLAAGTESGTQIVSAQRGDRALSMDVRAGLVRQSREVPLAEDPFLLDNNVISHYVVLFYALRAGAVPQTFSAAVPQALVSVPSRVEGPAEVRFQSGSSAYDGKKTTVYLGDTAIDLLSYEGRFVGLVNRTQGTTAYDAQLLPSGLTVLEPEPAAPASVLEKPVVFDSGGITLAGTLTLPALQTPPLCAVLFVAGSGPVDRDGNAPGFQMDAYRQLANALAEAGIASLRYDKRGVGESQGSAATASRSDLLGDVRAAWKALRARPEIASVPCVALGHSEGSYLVEELAAGDPSVAGIILLCGSPQSLASVTRWQVETLLRAQGASDEQVVAALEQEDQYIAFVKASSGQWKDYSAAALCKALPWLTSTAAEQLKASPLGLAWLREHYSAEPSAVLVRVACPVLILSADKDAQVPPADGEAMAKILRDEANADVTSILIPDLNHVLRHEPGPPDITYQHLNEALDPRVCAAIIDWERRTFGE